MDLAILQQLFERYNEVVEDYSLGTNPAQVVAVLRACQEGASSQQEVATRLKMKQPATHKWLGKFSAAGLMGYGPRQEDGSKMLRLTPKGCDLVAKLESATDQFLPPVPAPPASSEKLSEKPSNQPAEEEEDIGEPPDVGCGKIEEIYQRTKAEDLEKTNDFWKRKPKVSPRFRRH